MTNQLLRWRWPFK